MTKLKALSVSLTKHGAHKIAPLLKKYSANQILANLWGVEPGIKIDEAQAKKNLSVDASDRVPIIWEDARSLGSDAVDALVLLAIIFSHHELIKAMQAGRTAPFRGTITRGAVIDRKAYTNFAHVIEELGYSTAHNDLAVSFNLEPLFSITGLADLFRKLLVLKLRSAGWDQEQGLIDECTDLRFHETLAITADQFAAWLTTGSLTSVIPEDADFFSGADEAPASTPFVFRSGHVPKKTGKVGVKPTKGERLATLRHNEIQTEIFNALSDQYGKGNVGTEVATGEGTSIDVVLKTPKSCWFYEIKIAESVRACIRQAIPQLLEYGFWKCDDTIVEKLIIIGEFELTDAAEKYLEFLRGKFKLPIFYQQHLIVL
jgi:hypothetical protein